MKLTNFTSMRKYLAPAAMLTLLALLLLPSGGTSDTRVQFTGGYVVAVGVEVDDQGHPMLAEYDSDGKFVSDVGHLGIGTLQNVVLYPAASWRAFEEVNRTVLREHPMARGAQLMSASQYETRFFQTREIPPEPITKPNLLPNTKSVLVISEDRMLDPNPSKSAFVLAEYPIALHLNPGLVESDVTLILDERGQVIRKSRFDISFKTAVYKEDTEPGERDGNELFWNPIGNVAVSTGTPDMPLYPGGLTVSGEDGRYSMMYALTPCPGFAYEHRVPIVATLDVENFNPKAESLGFYTSMRYDYKWCIGYGDVPIGFTLQAQLAQLNAKAIVATLATPIYDVNVFFSSLQLSAIGKLTNEVINDFASLPGQDLEAIEFSGEDGETKYVENASLARLGVDDYRFDFNLDGVNDHVRINPDNEDLIDVYYSPNLPRDELGQPVPPDFTRRADDLLASQLTHQGLLSEINLSDLEDTDVYIYRRTTGQRLGAIEGLREGSSGGGTVNTRGNEKGRLTYRGVHDDEDFATFGFTSFLVGAVSNDTFSNIRSGELSADPARRRPWQTSEDRVTNFGNDNPPDGLRPGEVIQVIAINRATGYIGTQEIVLQPSGTMLEPPEPIKMGPPNIKVIASRVFDDVNEISRRTGIKSNIIGSEGAALTSDRYVFIRTVWLGPNGDLLPADLPGFTGRVAISTGSSTEDFGAHFPIQTGYQSHVVQLNNPSSPTREHFYVQVVGEPSSGSPSFGGIGAGEGRLETRPAKYVPVLVPLFDEVGTRDAQLAITQALIQGANVPRKADPIYHWVYRPEMQFSVYTLENQELRIQNIIEPGSQIDLTEVTDEFLLDLLTDPKIDFAELLFGLASADEDPLDFFGQAELVLAVDAEEVKAQIASNGQVTFDQPEHVSQLNDSEFQTIRLFQNNDSANVLWEYVIQEPIVAWPENGAETSQLRRVDIPNDWVCTSTPKFPIALNRNATVTLEFNNLNLFRDRYMPRGLTVEELPRMAPGVYEWKLTAVDDNDFTQEVEGFHEVKTIYNNSLSIGHVIEENIDLYDGHMVFSEPEFNIPARGPDLNLSRNYSSSTNRFGLLGPGWSHNQDAKIINVGCGAYAVSAGDVGGKFFNNVLEGTFRPERGLHSHLEKDGTDFNFYAKDGTLYHFTTYPFSGIDENGNRYIPYDRTGYQWFLEYKEDPDGNRTTYEYDNNASLQARKPILTRIVDSGGREVSFTYTDITPYSDIEGAFAQDQTVIASISAPDTEIAFEYSPTGRLVKVDNNGEIRRYEYELIEERPFTEEDELRVPLMRARIDPNGNRTEYDFELGELSLISDTQFQPVKTYLYTLVDHPISADTVIEYGPRDDRSADELTTDITNPRGFSSSYTMNAYGAPLIQAKDNGSIITTWDLDSVVMTSRTDERGVATTYEYDDYGNVISEKTGDIPAITRTFLSTGRAFTDKHIVNLVSSEKDRNGNTTIYEYDDEGHLTRIEYADRVDEIFSYFDNGDLETWSDGRNIITTYTFDDDGNPASVTAPDQGTTTYDYDARSLKVEQTDALGRVSSWDYDGQGRMITHEMPIGTMRYEYDENGNKTKEIDALQRETITRYDAEDRAIEIIRPIGSRIMDYDENTGDLIRETDWNGNETTYTYNSVHHRLTGTKPLGLVATYTNDEIGNVLRVDLPDGRFNAYTYDDLSRKTSETDPQGTTTYILNGEGQVLTEIDALDRETHQSFDVRNRLERVTNALDDFRTIEYDANGNPEVLTDENGNVTTNAYDDANRLIRSEKDGDVYLTEYFPVGTIKRTIDPLEREISYLYDDMDRQISKINNVTVETDEYDLAGNPIVSTTAVNTITRTFDELDRLTGESDLLGPIQTTGYDNNGNVTRTTDANGNITEIDYNALNFVTETRLPENRVVQEFPDVFGNVLTRIDPNGNQYTFTFDAANRLETETHPNGTLFYTYDAVGNLRSETDKRDNITEYIYDALNRVSEVIDPVGTLFYAYDANGNVRQETDRRDIVTTHSYDAYDRLLRSDRSGIRIVLNEYDGVGNPDSITDANGNTTEFTYNHLDQTLEERAPLDSTLRYAYNDAGQLVQTTDPSGRVMDYTVDPRGRNLSETWQGLQTAYTYDGNGNRLSMTRPQGNNWNYVYDGVDRLIQVQSPTGITAYAYDRNSNRTRDTDANGNVTRYEYDANDLMVKKIWPDNSEAVYAYDPNGNRTATTYPRGNREALTYDEVNRIITRNHDHPTDPSLNQTQTNVWDKNNNLLSVTYDNGHGSAIATNQYDDLDRQTQAVDRYGQVINYQYDDNGNRTQVQSPGGTTNYEYDEKNRVTLVSSTGSQTAYSYDRSDRLLTISHPGGLITQREYDPQARVERMRHHRGGLTISEYTYQYDGNSNRIEQTEINGGLVELTRYTYDSEDRLLEVDYPDEITSYSYDLNFNRLSERTTVKTTGLPSKDLDFSYDARDQIATVVDNLDNANNQTYQYDGNGNQVRKTRGTEITDFEYNARDELSRLEVDGNVLGEYRYDHQNLRIEKVSAGVTRRSTYDQHSLLQQMDDNNNLQQHFRYGPFQLVSLTETGGEEQFYLHDALGSAVALTTAAGDVTQRSQYDAWGVKTSETGGSANPIGFTGHQQDSETGLIYAKARYYDPTIGRFLNQDPHEGGTDTPPSLHRYLYAYANPTVYVDPDGRVVWFVPVLLYVGYTALTSAGDTAVEAGLDKAVTTVTGQESEFNAGESYAINFGINLITGGIGGKAKTTYRTVKAADTIIDAKRAKNAVEAAADSKKLDNVADANPKPKADTKIVKEDTNGVGADTTKPKSKTKDVDENQTSPKPDGEQTITFRHKLKEGKETDIDELNRQVKGQEEGFNKIIEEEGIEGLQQRIKDFKADPSIATEGRKRTRDLGPVDPGDARLHNPDMSMGGNLDPTDIGKSRENSILGGNAQRIREEILEFPDTTTCVRCELEIIE